MERIIGAHDINRLLKYAYGNLSTYSILYKPCGRKRQYFLMIFFGLITLLICIYDVTIFVLDVSHNSSVILNIVLIIITSYYWVAIVKFRDRMQKHIQIKRKRLLLNYYISNKYTEYELDLIVKLLKMKIYKSNTNIWHVFILFGTLIFPVWNTFVERWIEHNNSPDILLNIFVRVILITILVLCMYIFAKPINYALTFNQRIMNNLIYLTQYILEEGYIE